MKRLTAVLFFTFFTTIIFAQTEGMYKQAGVLIEKMNAEIISENPALALSDKQKTEIKDLIAKRILASVEAGKSESDEEKRKEAIKVAIKPYNQKIFDVALTKEQKMALDAARKKASQK